MITQDRITLLRRRTFTEVVGDSFAFIRLNLGVILKVHFLLSLPIIIVTAAVFLLLFREHFTLFGTLSSGVFEDSIAFRDDMANFAVARLFTMFAVMPVSINTLIIVDRYHRSTTGVVTFEDVWAVAKRKYLPILLAKVIMAPIIFFTSMLLILPGIAFYTLFMCVEMLMLQHDYGVFKAMGKSTSVMTRFFWMPFLASLVFIGMYLLFVGLMTVPVSILESVQNITTSYFDPSDPWAMLSISLRTFNTVLSYLVYTIPTVAVGMMYFSLREQASQSSIMDRIKAIGTEKRTTKNQFSLGDEHY